MIRRTSVVLLSLTTLILTTGCGGARPFVDDISRLAGQYGPEVAAAADDPSRSLDDVLKQVTASDAWQTARRNVSTGVRISRTDPVCSLLIEELLATEPRTQAERLRSLADAVGSMSGYGELAGDARALAGILDDYGAGRVDRATAALSVFLFQQAYCL
jgi:hypothetical protein